jgi:hypothetical protein
LSFQGIVTANHPYSPKQHISSVQTNTIADYFCVDATDSRITRTTVSAYTLIKNILYFRNYDGLGNLGAINFVQGGSGTTACSKMTSTELSTMYFRNYIQKTTDPLCDGTHSCIKRFLPSTVNGHTHYTYGILTIKDSSLTGVPDYMINHETGHLSGMLDGGPSAPISLLVVPVVLCIQ